MCDMHDTQYRWLLQHNHGISSGIIAYDIYSPSKALIPQACEYQNPRHLLKMRENVEGTSN
jgi:hypothetical protein